MRTAFTPRSLLSGCRQRVARWSDDGESMLDFNIVNPPDAVKPPLGAGRTPAL